MLSKSALCVSAIRERHFCVLADMKAAVASSSSCPERMFLEDSNTAMRDQGQFHLDTLFPLLVQVVMIMRPAWHLTVPTGIKCYPIVPFPGAISIDENTCPKEVSKLTTSQSMPSGTPRPSMAEHATILQLRSLSSPSRRASDISPAPLAPG